jgi:CO/xanthine dehydrogenase Mo-binding subunit
MTMFLDGSVNVRVGFQEIGQGITGVITRITSEVLGVPEEKVSILYSDSHATPKAGSLGFSQGTVLCGKALLSGATKLKERMEEHAKEYLKTRDIDDGISVEDVEFKGGDFYIGDKMCLKFGELANYCYRMGKNMAVTGWYEGTSPDDRHGITFMSALVDVEVDERTGAIQVLKIINCHDIGKVLNENSAKGQLTGGSVMSMGITLNEEFVIENGKPVTSSYTEYLIPTAKDIPQENIALFVECPGQECPMGAKGLGEHPLYAAGPAISNAIFDAIGVSITHLPITPERVLKALNKI